MSEVTLHDLATMTQAALSKIGADVDKGFAARKTREQEFEAKQNELQARVREIEQRAARPQGEGGPAGGEYGGGLGDAAGDVINGLKGSNNVRVQLPTASARRLALHAATVLTGADLPHIPLAPVSVYRPQVARLIDLLQSMPVSGGNTIDFVRVDYSHDSPDGNKAAKQAGEGALKAESSIATTLVSLPLDTFAHFTKVSKQCLDDSTEMRQILNTILAGGLLDVVDRDIFSVLTTTGNFTAFSPVGGETTADGVTRIAAAIAAKGGQNISVCLNPADYLGMQLHKASTSGIYLGVPQTLASRVVACPAVTSGKLLAFAGTGAQWADRESVNVTAGIVDDSFVRNLVVLLAELRGAVLVRDPGLIEFGNATA